MKKIIFLGSVILALCIAFNPNVLAQSKKDKEKSQEEKPSEKPEKKDTKKDAKKTTVKKDTILGNKVFVVEVINMDAKKGTGKKMEDVIEFKGNKIKSKLFEEEGFPAVDYVVVLDSTVTENKVYNFLAESKNPEGLVLKWEGTWDGEEFSGSALKTKKEKPKGSFEFKGYEKKKKKK